jgi:hypothetical protein
VKEQPPYVAPTFKGKRKIFPERDVILLPYQESFASRETKRFKETDLVMKYWEIIADNLRKGGAAGGFLQKSKFSASHRAGFLAVPL